MNMTVGVDVGQSVDPTAIIVLDSFVPEPQHIDDDPGTHHMIRWAEKVPLGTSYNQVVERIAVVAEQANEYARALIAIDATGVGRPVVDMLRKRTSIQMRAITFTGASAETRTGAYGFRVPKRDLVTALEVVLQERRLHAVPDLPLIEDLQAELATFEVNISARGHNTFDAASGKHDDLVMALCLAIWSASRHGEGQAFMTAWRNMAAKHAVAQ